LTHQYNDINGFEMDIRLTEGYSEGKEAVEVEEE
jgi:hypothetical protein